MGLKKIRDSCSNILNTFAAFFSFDALLFTEEYELVASSGNSVTRPESICFSLLEKTKETRGPVFFDSEQRQDFCRECGQENCPTEPILVFPLLVEEKVMGYLILAGGGQEFLANREKLARLAGFIGELITGKLIEQTGFDDIRMVIEQLGLVINSIDEGIIAIDHEGMITNFNNSAGKLIGERPSRVWGSHINKIFPSGDLLEVLASGEGFRNREVFHQGENSSMRLLVTANPILKGVRVAGVVASIKSIQEVHGLLGGEIAQGDSFLDQIVGESPVLLEVKDKVLRVAGSSSSVLIQGESGTGKELFARAIHQASQRRKENFVSINCAAIPAELLESELFGYEAGAFTGALTGGKPGKFELAHRGTIFLDEIGDMPLELQVKILRVIQDRKFFRIGGVKEIDVDVRILAASNQDLEELIRVSKFREDLFYRLNVIPMEIPPLRKRKEDIMLLVEHFIQKYNVRLRKKIEGVTEGARWTLEEYDWPGNVRELENVIEYAINMEPSAYITTENLPARMIKATPQIPVTEGNLRENLEEYERKLITEYLDIYGRDTPGKLKAAKALGIGKTTLYNKLKNLGIQ